MAATRDLPGHRDRRGDGGAEASTTDTLGEGIVLGLVTGIGGAAASLYGTDFFDPQKPKPLTTAINAGYHVVGILIVGAIVGAWT